MNAFVQNYKFHWTDSLFFLRALQFGLALIQATQIDESFWSFAINVKKKLPTHFLSGVDWLPKMWGLCHFFYMAISKNRGTNSVAVCLLNICASLITKT